MWDAGQYLRFGGERARPFFDLMAQVGATSPRYVADLGCGPGNLTAALAERWPGATVTGVDNSAEMIAAARAKVPRAANLSFEVGDVRDWRPRGPVDVLVCNAVLQWVPGHDEILLRWADLLAPAGWLAFQLPATSTSPATRSSRKWPAHPAGARRSRTRRSIGRRATPRSTCPCSPGPASRWTPGRPATCTSCTGENPVLEWTKGSTLRPVLSALDAEQADAFLREYGERVRDAYRPHSFGTVFPFRRVFTVVHRAGRRAG